MTWKAGGPGKLGDLESWGDAGKLGGRGHGGGGGGLESWGGGLDRENLVDPESCGGGGGGGGL